MRLQHGLWNARAVVAEAHDRESSSRPASTSIMPPRGVYLQELPNRFVKTCARRTGIGVEEDRLLRHLDGHALPRRLGQRPADLERVVERRPSSVRSRLSSIFPRLIRLTSIRSSTRRDR
jgi:hypothetical protein